MPTTRELIDPDHTLPSVTLEPTQIQEHQGLARHTMTIVADAVPVGSCDLITQTEPYSPKAHFDGVEIDTDQRGRGIGLATYLLAIEYAHAQGLPFETQDYDQTADSRKIWESLAAIGVAEVIEPFQPSKVREGRFIGKFRVPPAIS